MHEEIETAPLLLDFFENGIDGGDVLHVARQHEIRADLFGKRFHALAQRITLIGEGQFGALCGELFCNAPGQ